MVRKYCSRVVVAHLLLSPVRAWGQQQAATAEDLFRDGRRELLAGNYEVACGQLRRSDELDPAPGTKLNLGECEALRGHIATAWELLKLAEQQLLPGDARLPIARGKRETLEPRLPKLQLVPAESAPKDMRVRFGSRELEPAAAFDPIPLDPGLVSFVVTAPGRPDRRFDVMVEEGKTTQVTIAPASLPNPPIASTSPANSPRFPSTMVEGWRSTNTLVTPAPTHQGPSGRVRAGTAVVTVGVVGTALGAIAGVMALDAKRTNQENCSDETQSCNQTGRDAAHRGRILGTLTTTGLLIGGVGIAVGTYLIVSSNREPGPVTRLTLRNTTTGASVTMERTF